MQEFDSPWMAVSVGEGRVFGWLAQDPEIVRTGIDDRNWQLR
jgi:hypothetical protein